MISVPDAIFYVLSFLAVYVQVFLLVTFIENRKKIKERPLGDTKLSRYPGVTVIVPCWNEENTVAKTVRSLFNLNYPKEKLKIILVDDGSTDNTWKIISGFAKHPQVRVLQKENGGKHTALNLALEQVDTEYLGCLDADSTADRESLVRIMQMFEEDKKLMAVTPSIIVENARNMIQKAQKAEYYMSNVFVKKMLAFMGAIHVTPGPLTIFKKKVFDDLGPYRFAHNTEDMEIAYRMQKNHYPIEQCHDAYVYTGTPPTVVKLYKQRLRWIYGFINNTIDYRHLMFKKGYGNFSFFTVPAGVLSMISSSYIFGKSIYNVIELLSKKFVEYQTVGVDLSPKAVHMDPFFFNTQISLFVSIFVLFLVVVSVVLGYRMVKGKDVFSMDMIYFFIIFSFISPFWLLKAIYNTLLSRKPAWR